MAEWTNYKSIRKLCKDDGDHLKFIYYNWSYSRQTVSLVDMLLEEIHKDFPEQSSDNIFIEMLPKFPHEILLYFYCLKDEVKDFDLSQFEKMPDDINELNWPNQESHLKLWLLILLYKHLLKYK